MLTFTVEELIRFLSNWTMTFFEGAKRSGDIVFSRYYSFFKHPVLVREHQVESLYVMVQNRDSSDNKKPSFSRFAKWEFGGFIVDSKTIYMCLRAVSGRVMVSAVSTKRPCAMTSVPYTLWQAQSCVSAPPMRISQIFVRFLLSALLSAKSA